MKYEPLEVGAPPNSILQVLETRVYRGGNLYSRRPMVRIRIQLGRLEAWPSNRLPGFNDRLLELLPGLRTHGCSRPRSGGFPKRLSDGTWMGHVIEHVALELQTSGGSPVSRGKTRSVKGQPGCYDVLYGYKDEQLALAAGASAIRLVVSLLPSEHQGMEGDALLVPALSPDPQNVDAILNALGRLNAANVLGPTTASLVEAADRRAIPVRRFKSHIQLGYGSKQKRIRASITSNTSQMGVVFACDKFTSKALLKDNALPVPRGDVVRSADEAVVVAADLGQPVAVKPLDGNHGRGVSVNLVEESQIRDAFERAAAVNSRVIVEQHLTGKDYRILVVGGKVVAAAERVPAHVRGDGSRTIRQLIEILNSDPRRGIGHENVLTKIKIDPALEDKLHRQGRSLDCVPGHGDIVMLRGAANLSSGGTAIDCTDGIHSHNRLVAEAAALTIGLDVAGIDFVTPDISQPVNLVGGGIVEVNAAPGFRMHLSPSEGKPRDVAKPVIEQLFGPHDRGRIPIVAITGTNGKTTTGRMVAAILRESGLRVGRSDTSGVFLNDLKIKAGDSSGPRSAAMVLSNPAVDAAVLETARGGILREGLAFDTCSVGAVLNISEDHLGVKGVNTVEELANIKAVVVQAVARQGVTVLNFDDPLTRAMAQKARSRIIWFSLKSPAQDLELTKMLNAGGMAVLRESDPESAMLTLYAGDKRTYLMPASAIPATAGGRAGFNVANALAATAIAHGLGISNEIIAQALTQFQSNYDDNPGRFNIINSHSFRVLLDYAHNPASLEALGESLSGLHPPGTRTIGMVSIPGDRRDQDILEIGRLSASIFDHIVFREAPDGRGRPRGAVLALLEQGARLAGAGDRISCVFEERDAVDFCLSMAEPGDLVVLLPTRVEEVYQQVKSHSPVETNVNVSA